MIWFLLVVFHIKPSSYVTSDINSNLDLVHSPTPHPHPNVETPVTCVWKVPLLAMQHISWGFFLVLHFECQSNIHKYTMMLSTISSSSLPVNVLTSYLMLSTFCVISSSFQGPASAVLLWLRLYTFISWYGARVSLISYQPATFGCKPDTYKHSSSATQSCLYEQASSSPYPSAVVL